MEGDRTPIKLLKAALRISVEHLGLLPYARRVQAKIDRELFTLRQNRLTPEEIEAIYAEQYHERSNYGKFEEKDTGWEPDSVMKLAHAKAITRVLPHIKKVLVGGCSSGMGVLAFRRIGLDCWGFDISPDLDRMVLPEVKAYVRRGSMVDIPYDASHRFDCFVTTDVLEHIQLKYVDRMFKEMARLACPWMTHLINHTSIQPDHMTLKPLNWWAKKARPNYRLRADLKAPESGNPRIYGLNGDPLHVYTFWERV